MDVFDIKLDGFEDTPGRDPSADLARVFGIDLAKARRIVAGTPVLVKKGVAEDVAEHFFHALRDIGAKVTIEKRSVVSLTPPGLAASRSGPPPGARGFDSLSAPAGTPLPMPDFDVDPFERGFAGVEFESTGAATAGTGASAGASGHDQFDEWPPSAELDIDPEALASVRPPSRASVHPPSRASVRPPSRAPFSSPPAAGGPSSVAPSRTARQAARSGFPMPVASEVRKPFLHALLSAFAYPIQKRALPILLGVALVSQLLGYIWVIGWFLSLAVIATYLFAIIRATHNDKDELPTASDFTDLSDLIGPAIRYMLALIVPFVPAVALAFLLPPGGPSYLIGIVLAVIAGILYMPASFMVAALGTGCLAPLNPVAGVMIIARVPGPYVLVTLAVGSVIALEAVVGIAWQAAAPSLATIPFFPALLAAMIGLVFSFIAARMLGLFLRHYENELGLGA